MRPILIVVLVGVALATAGIAGSQLDVAKALEGKWEGEFLKEATDKFENARTLVIGKARQEDGKWLVEGARYGITGKGLGRMDVRLNVDGDKVTLEFETPGAKNPVKLSLAPDGTLGGTIYLATVSNRNQFRPFKLKKVE
jgi:hypothetical protein